MDWWQLQLHNYIRNSLAHLFKALIEFSKLVALRLHHETDIKELKALPSSQVWPCLHYLNPVLHKLDLQNIPQWANTNEEIVKWHIGWLRYLCMSAPNTLFSSCPIFNLVKSIWIPSIKYSSPQGKIYQNRVFFMHIFLFETLKLGTASEDMEVNFWKRKDVFVGNGPIKKTSLIFVTGVMAWKIRMDLYSLFVQI